MNQMNTLAEHVDIVVGLFIGTAFIVGWFLRSTYKGMSDKLDRVEACLNEVKKGYVRHKDCSSSRDQCRGYQKEDSDRIVRILERLEKNTDRNFDMIFYLADGLVKKKVLDGDDLENLRDKKNSLGK